MVDVTGMRADVRNGRLDAAELRDMLVRVMMMLTKWFGMDSARMLMKYWGGPDLDIVDLLFEALDFVELASELFATLDAAVEETGMQLSLLDTREDPQAYWALFVRQAYDSDYVVP